MRRPYAKVGSSTSIDDSALPEVTRPLAACACRCDKPNRQCPSSVIALLGRDATEGGASRQFVCDQWIEPAVPDLDRLVEEPLDSSSRLRRRRAAAVEATVRTPSRSAGTRNHLAAGAVRVRACCRSVATRPGSPCTRLRSCVPPRSACSSRKTCRAPDRPRGCRSRRRRSAVRRAATSSWAPRTPGSAGCRGRRG